MMAQTKIAAREIEGSNTFFSPIRWRQSSFIMSTEVINRDGFISFKNSDTRQLSAVCSLRYIKKINMREIKHQKAQPRVGPVRRLRPKRERTVQSWWQIKENSPILVTPGHFFSHQNFILGTIHHCPERPRNSQGVPLTEVTEALTSWLSWLLKVRGTDPSSLRHSPPSHTFANKYSLTPAKKQPWCQMLEMRKINPRPVTGLKRVLIKLGSTLLRWTAGTI